MESKLQLLSVFRQINEIGVLANELQKTNKRLSNSKDINALAEMIYNKVETIGNGAE